jgi:hypothetical protein
MMFRFLLACVAGFLLAGCTAAPGIAASQGTVARGYLYHDANHPNGVSQTSPQAEYNAAHGTWLWPPAENDRPG